MDFHDFSANTPQGDRPEQPGGAAFALRYCFGWALLVAALAYGIHCYFEYRNRELDKRLEQIMPAEHPRLH